MAAESISIGKRAYPRHLQKGKKPFVPAYSGQICLGQAPSKPSKAGPIGRSVQHLELIAIGVSPSLLTSLSNTFDFDQKIGMRQHIGGIVNQTWTGTDQVRFYKLDGNTLTISGAPAPDPYTGRQVIHRIVFEKLR